MSKIQWTNETWNPIAGCSKISEGCANCYAIKDAHRLAGNPNPKISEKYKGTTKSANGYLNWTGRINLAREEVITQPLRWTKPRRIFVNSMSDLFHKDVPKDWIWQIFHVIANAPKHTFQILTKRADRMAEIVPSLLDEYAGVSNFSNLWLGVSIENQRTAETRIPFLLDQRVGVRWVSAEPLLGDINFKFSSPQFATPNFNTLTGELSDHRFTKLDWVVVGGESGQYARPCSIEAMISIVNQCKAASVPVFVKQLGKYPVDWRSDTPEAPPYEYYPSDSKGANFDDFPKELQFREYPR